jgi:hypothetical protein
MSNNDVSKINVLRAAWIAALRSGRYEKCTGRIRRGNSFCALGVLLDVGTKMMLGEWVIDVDGDWCIADDRVNLIYRKADLTENAMDAITRRNDFPYNKTFEQIADYVEMIHAHSR